jgi:hypothetical protein
VLILQSSPCTLTHVSWHQVVGEAIKVQSKLSAHIKARMRTKDEFQALPVAQQSGKALLKDMLLI